MNHKTQNPDFFFNIVININIVSYGKKYYVFGHTAQPNEEKNKMTTLTTAVEQVKSCIGQKSSCKTAVFSILGSETIKKCD